MTWIKLWSKYKTVLCGPFEFQELSKHLAKKGSIFKVFQYLIFFHSKFKHFVQNLQWNIQENALFTSLLHFKI